MHIFHIAVFYVDVVHICVLRLKRVVLVFLRISFIFTCSSSSHSARGHV